MLGSLHKYGSSPEHSIPIWCWVQKQKQKPFKCILPPNYLSDYLRPQFCVHADPEISMPWKTHCGGTTVCCTQLPSHSHFNAPNLVGKTK